MLNRCAASAPSQAARGTCGVALASDRWRKGVVGVDNQLAVRSRQGPKRRANDAVSAWRFEQPTSKCSVARSGGIVPGAVPREKRTPVRRSRGAGELGLAADLHALHAFGPARDDAAEWELRRLVALVRAVEFAAVREGAR